MCYIIRLVLVLKNLWSFLVFVTLIGETILTQEGPQRVMFFFWEEQLSHGLVRNKRSLFFLLQNLSTWYVLM